MPHNVRPFAARLPADGSGVSTSDSPPQPRERAKRHLGHRARLRERFREAGPEALPDYELLEMVLYGAFARKDTKPLAKELIEKFGSFGEVLSAPEARLREAEGIGDAAISMIKIVHAAAARLRRSEMRGRPALSSWQAVLDYCRTAMAYENTEQLRILFLNKRNQLIRDERQQVGTVDHTPVYPREVVKRALELAATAIILVHNHPSGDPSPSRADIEMTRAIADAARGLGINLHDHIIVGRLGHVSLKALGLIS
jgi:DNA repair protein RadC